MKTYTTVFVSNFTWNVLTLVLTYLYSVMITIIYFAHIVFLILFLNGELLFQLKSFVVVVKDVGVFASDLAFGRFDKVIVLLVV